LVLKRAYVQQPLCAPSRASILTGRRPDTTRVHGFHENFRQRGGNFTTIPQFFKNKGYNTIGLGKIFHYSPEELWNDDPISWSEPVWHATINHEGYSHSWNAISENQLTDKPLRDQQLTKKAIETIQRIAPDAKAQKRNFFLGVGFYKPHLPFVFPLSMLELYPESSISIPDPINIQVPFNMPKIAWSDYIFLRNFKDIKAANVSGEFNTLVPEYKMKELRRAYYSTVSFIDSEIGKILTELNNLGLSKNTIVVFWSDHGFHLGENGEWCKHTAFELSTWSPLMIHIPGVTDAGINTYELTEFVDLFPSLVEAAGRGTT
jgi:iduronate 2-sulfatase